MEMIELISGSAEQQSLCIVTQKLYFYRVISQYTTTCLLIGPGLRVAGVRFCGAKLCVTLLDLVSFQANASATPII